MIVQAAGGIRVMVMLKDYRIDLEAMARAITPMTKIVFIANPNNPTATIVTADEVDALHVARCRERTIVVFDEAYIEFAQGPDFPDALGLRRPGPQGRGAAHVLEGGQPGRPPRRLRRHRRRRHRADEPHPPAVQRELAGPGRRRWPRSTTSSHALECVRMIEAGRHYLYDEFNALGVKYVPSRANFILVDVGRSASDIYQRLLKEGVIVRPLTPFGMESALRVTVGTPQENRRLVKALRTVLGKNTA